MSNFKVLLVDDEPDILELIQYNLEKEGYDVETANNGREGVEKALISIPDLILLDVMMPEMDGIETCHLLRENEDLNKTIIAFLTARSEDYSQIAGLDAGADDYITKPIKPKVLISRVKALMRRKYSDGSKEFEIPEKGISVDKTRYIAFKDAKEMSLPKKEFELLALLISHPGRVFTRDHILNSVWGKDVIVGDRTIDVHIRKLREKFGDKYFRTVKGVGYKFEG